jgi:signal transduction histidine kinase
MIWFMALQHCTVEHLAEGFGGCQEEIIGEWRLQAAELLSELNLDKLTITDHLPDVIAEMLAKVFDKLATDPDKAGTGLGLTIVKQIVEAHGGTVSAESTHGAGATLSFTIPTPDEG